MTGIGKQKTKWNMVLSILVVLGLSGCSEVQLASHYAKKLPWPGKSAKSQGAYKIGKPYKINGVTYYPREDFNMVETGIASWYGPGFHGKRTANGEIYDQFELTAAHKTLQMPSLVRVTNLDNGRSIVVRVNDRGPYAHGRIIDMSRRGAELLGFKNKGTAPVKVEVLERESKAIASAAKSGQDTSNFAARRIPSNPTEGNVKLASATPNNYQPVPSYQARSYNDNGSVAVLKNDAEALPESLRPVTKTGADLKQAGAGPIPLNGEAVKAPAPVEVANLSTPPKVQYQPATLNIEPMSAELKTAQERDERYLNELSFLQDTEVKGHESQSGNFVPDPVVTNHPVLKDARIYVQAGAFSVQGNAERLVSKLSNIAPAKISSVIVEDTTYHRVRLGPISTVEEADTVLAQVISAGQNGARIIVD